MNASSLRSRVTRVAPVSLLLGLLLLGGPVIPVRASDCPAGSPQCIAGLKIIPHGMFVRFNFLTTSPGLAGVEVGTKPPGPGPAFNQADVVNATFAGTGLQHVIDLDRLVPGTTFFYIISAFDGKGNEVRSTGTFTTLFRKVTVTFGHIHIGQATKDNLTFEFERYGWLLDAKTHQPADMLNGEWGDGDDIFPNISSTVVGHKEDPMIVGVFGYGQECDDVTTYLCRAGYPSALSRPRSSNHDPGDYNWNTATTQVSFGVGGEQEEFDQVIFFDTATGTDPLQYCDVCADLHFSVTAFVQVRYVATLNG
jgi:hypothetical protein